MWWDKPGSKKTQFDETKPLPFMKIRWIGFIVTGVIFLVTTISLATQGLNMGLDFTGGVQIEATQASPFDVGKVRDDRLDAVLGDVLIIDDEVVVYRHEGDVDRIGRALMDGGAARAVAVVEFENTARFGLCRQRGDIRSRQQRQRHGRKRAHAPHVPLPRCFSLIGPIVEEVSHDGALAQPARPAPASILRIYAIPCDG